MAQDTPMKDLSTLTDEELLALYEALEVESEEEDAILAEIEARNLDI